MDRLKFDRIETALSYLTDLVSFAETEVDNYLLKKSSDFAKTRELGRILEEFQLRDDTTSLSSVFPYIPFWRAVRKNSDKGVIYTCELALEMRLLRYELDNVPFDDTKRLEQLRSVLYDLFIEFLSETRSGYIFTE